MEHFLVVTNSQKDPEFKYTNHIKEYLTSRGRNCVIETRDNLGDFDMPQNTEGIIVLGGDGTLLRAARETVNSTIPLIGVNLGTLGYLAEVESSNLDTALERLMADEYTTEKRMMLAGKTWPVGEEQNAVKAYALNDIVIARNGSVQLNTFHIYVNGQLLNTYHADGILLATPTGSTGYNLSAGGPIVEPKAEMILLTPICPHTLNTRTIILSADDQITIEIGENKKGQHQSVEACFDGSEKVPLETGDKLEIFKSSKTTEIMKLSQVSFLEVLHKKMRE